MALTPPGDGEIHPLGHLKYLCCYPIVWPDTSVIYHGTTYIYGMRKENDIGTRIICVMIKGFDHTRAHCLNLEISLVSCT